MVLYWACLHRLDFTPFLWYVFSHNFSTSTDVKFFSDKKKLFILFDEKNPEHYEWNNYEKSNISDNENGIIHR